MFTSCTFLNKKMTRKIKFLKRILTSNDSQSIFLQNAKQNVTLICLCYHPIDTTVLT